MIQAQIMPSCKNRQGEARNCGFLKTFCHRRPCHVMWFHFLSVTWHGVCNNYINCFQWFACMFFCLRTSWTFAVVCVNEWKQGDNFTTTLFVGFVWATEQGLFADDVQHHTYWRHRVLLYILMKQAFTRIAFVIRVIANARHHLHKFWAHSFLKIDNGVGARVP